MKTLEQVAQLVAEKMPQERLCDHPGPRRLHHLAGCTTVLACDHCGGSMKTAVTAADLLHDEHGDGRPSRWLWALFVKWVGTLEIHGDNTATAQVWDGEGRNFEADGDTPIDAIGRALGALCEAQ